MKRTRLFHTFAGGGSPPMQRNNNQGYDLDESSQFLDLDLAWTSGTQGQPRTHSPENFTISLSKGEGNLNRQLEDMRRRTQEAEFTASFQSHCTDGSAYATFEDLSSLAAADITGSGSNSPVISGSGTPTPTSPLLDDSTRNLNKSIESVFIALAAESDADNLTDSQAPRRNRLELSLRPLERSRSLEILPSPSCNESTLCLTGGDVVRHSGEVNNNDNVQELGNTSAGAADANLLRELGPRATTSSKSENTTGSASRVEVVEPLIERSFVDVAETCIPVIEDEHLLQTTPNRLLLEPPHRVDGDGSDGDTTDTDGERSPRPEVNRGIYSHDASVIISDAKTKSSQSDCVHILKEEEPLIIKEDTKETTMAESKMMAKMPHDVVSPSKDPQTPTGSGGSGQAQIPSITSIIEAVRSNQTEKLAKQLLAVEERLDTAECMADDLLDQNNALRTEVRELELEIEEAKDHYRQSDVEEYRELKSDLDRAIKDYRILQYRLRKAERKSEEAESQKQQFEEKYKSSGSAQGSGESTPDEERSSEMIGLQQELKVAKEVSIRLHQELEMIEDKRAKTDEENQILRQKMVESEAIRKEMKRELEKTRTEVSSVLTYCIPPS